jgi:hypothetical protein
MGYRPFIDSPLDRYMLDSMILWMKMMFWFLDFFCLNGPFSWLYEPGGIWGEKALKCV